MKEHETISNSEGSMVTFCSFRLADRLFGVNILDVKEIGGEIRISTIHHAPKAISGYMNIRGQIHLVIDLRRVFNFDPAELSPNSRVIIFKSTVDEPFGVIVDGMDDVVTVSSERIEERRRKGDEVPSEIRERRKAAVELTQGVCKLDKGLMVILNAKGIIAEAMGLVNKTDSNN